MVRRGCRRQYIRLGDAMTLRKRIAYYPSCVRSLFGIHHCSQLVLLLLYDEERLLVVFSVSMVVVVRLVLDVSCERRPKRKIQILGGNGRPFSRDFIAHNFGYPLDGGHQ